MLDTLKQTWRGASEDDAGLVAAGVSYYAFLAMVPLLAVCVLLYGLVATPDAVARDIAALGRGLPPSAASLIGDQLRSGTEANDNAKGLGLAIALALALFGARNAARGVIRGLNVVFNVEEDRGFLKSNAIALVVTVGAVFALALAGTAVSLVAALPGAAARDAGRGLSLSLRPQPPRPAMECSLARRCDVRLRLGWRNRAFRQLCCQFRQL